MKEMIIQIIQIVCLIPIVFILHRVYKTLRIGLKYKKMYGEDIAIRFFPGLGLKYYLITSFRKYGDEYFFLKKFMIENPKTKGILFLSGFMNIFVLIDNEWVKNFSQDSHIFTKGETPLNFANFFSQCMFFVPHKTWKRQRLFLNSNFHFEAIKTRVQLIKEVAQTFDIQQQIDGQKFNKIKLISEIQKLTSAVVIKTFLGGEFNGVKIEGEDFHKYFSDMIFEVFPYSITSPYFNIKKYLLGNDRASRMFLNGTEKTLLTKMNNLLDCVTKTIDRLITEAQQKYIDPNEMEIRNNFLDLYIKELLIQQYNKGKIEYKEEEILTKKEIIHQFFNFYNAGMDTTANQVTMTIYELSKNKEIYNKLMQEINGQILKYDDIQHSDLSKLTYLDMVMKETLRLHPAAMFTFPRFSNKDYTRDSLFIEKDLYTSHKLIQYSDKQGTVYEQPFTYDPERFINSTPFNNPFDYIPFSAGPRNCIGQHLGMVSAKLMTIYILKNYEIQEVKDYKLKKSLQFIYSAIDPELVMMKKMNKQ